MASGSDQVLQTERVRALRLHQGADQGVRPRSSAGVDRQIVALELPGGLTMAAITRVFTLARVAEMLGEDQDWLEDISDELEPEDGLIAVYGTGEEYTVAFTEFGIENLKQAIRNHRTDASRINAEPQ